MIILGIIGLLTFIDQATKIAEVEKSWQRNP